MTRVCSIFSQILQLFPRLEFEFATRKHNAERHARQTSLSFGEAQHPGDRREILDCLSYIMVYT
jgi:hypothetical protein